MRITSSGRTVIPSWVFVGGGFFPSKSVQSRPYPKASMPMPKPKRWARPAAVVSGIALLTVAGSNLAPIPWAITMSALLSLFMISVRRLGE